MNYLSSFHRARIIWLKTMSDEMIARRDELKMKIKQLDGELYYVLYIIFRKASKMFADEEHDKTVEVCNIFIAKTDNLNEKIRSKCINFDAPGCECIGCLRRYTFILRAFCHAEQENFVDAIVDFSKVGEDWSRCRILQKWKRKLMKS